jgi:hypothetical protein
VVKSLLMLALAHLRIDALLAVLIVTACVMLALRVWVAVSRRAIATRDAQVIAEVEAARRAPRTDLPQ